MIYYVFLSVILFVFVRFGICICTIRYFFLFRSVFLFVLFGICICTEVKGHLFVWARLQWNRWFVTKEAGSSKNNFSNKLRWDYWIWLFPPYRKKVGKIRGFYVESEVEHSKALGRDWFSYYCYSEC